MSTHALSWKVFAGVSLSLALSLACSKQTEPETPAPDPFAVPPEESPEPEEIEPEPAPPAADPEPEFRSGSTVEEAINAVPPTAKRIQIEDDALAEPLKNPDLYAPCKLKASQHFTVRVAVWNGKAVGLDIATKPQSAALESCLREQIESITWKDKVKSLNTVEFSF